MKLSKILAGVSLAALITGNANALDLTLTDANGSDTAVASITQAVSFADESRALLPGEPTSGRTGDFELRVGVDGTIAAGQNIFVTIDVTGGTFSSAVTGAAVTDGDLVSGADIFGSTIQFAGGVATGLEGSNSVTFLVSVDATSPTGADHFGVELPVLWGGCDTDLGFEVTLTTETGTPIEEGTVPLETPAIANDSAVSCFNAYQAAVGDDRSGGDYDSILTSASGFATFDPAVGAPGVDLATGTVDPSVFDVPTGASIGTATVEWNPDNAAGPLFLARLDTPSTPLDGDEAGGLTFDVQFEDLQGLDASSMEAGSQAGVPLFEGSTVFDFLISGLPSILDDNYQDNIVLAVDGKTQVLPQTPVVLPGAALLFSDTTLLIDNEAATVESLDDLNYEGVQCGVFDWFGDANAGTLQFIRATGYGDEVSLIQAIIEDATDPTFDGMIVDLPNVAGANETIITNVMIGNVAGDYTRANVSLNFVGAQQSLDCDRLQVSPANFALSPFGNGTATSSTELDEEDGDDN